MKTLGIISIFLLCFAGTTFAQSAIVPVGGDAQSNSGMMLQTLNVSENLSQFQIGHYATGTYYLELRDGKRVLKTFKVVRS